MPLSGRFLLSILSLTCTLALAAIDQNIDFDPLPDTTFGAEPIDLVATSDSGLTVAFSLINSPAGSLTGNRLTFVSAGFITVRATQAGDTNFNPASVERTFGVGKAPQTITFSTIGPKTLGDPPFSASVSSSSGLPVDFHVTGPASLSGGLIFITGAGAVTLHAENDGNDDYQPAHDHKSFTVAKGAQSVTVNLINPKIFGDDPFAVGGSSTSGLTVVYSIVSGPATITGNVVTLTGAGNVVVRGSHPGDTNFLPAAPFDRSFAVGRGNQTLAFIPFPNKTFGDAPFAVGAPSSSKLPVTLSVLSGPATVAGSIVTLTGAGTVTLQAAQLGDDNYNAAPPVTQTFTVAKATPSIKWNFPDNITAGTPLGNLQLNASSVIAGEISYIPQAGTILGVGSNQSLLALFTPFDDTRYNSVTATVKINVDNAPPLLASLTAFPVSPNVNQSTIFSAAGSDTDVLSYAWSFSDGAHGSGASVSRVFSTPGTFQASVMVTDTHGGTAQASINIVVRALSPIIADGGDADGDGFPDAIEIAAGTSPQNASDTPGDIAPAGDALALPDVKLNIKLSFAKPGRDALTLSGTLLLPADMETPGAVVVDVGGVATMLELNAKGVAKTANDQFKISVKGNGARSGRFTLKRKKGDFAALLAAVGLTNETVQAEALVPVAIYFQNELYHSRVKQAYKARQGKTGQSRDLE